MRHSKMINPVTPAVGSSAGKLALWLLLLAISAQNCFALGEACYVEAVSRPGNVALCDGTVAAILVDTNDWPGVVRAAGDLAADIRRVTGQSPKIFNQLKSAGQNVVIVGTIGQSEFIDRLIREKKIEVADTAGKWESFFLQVVPKPFPGIESALVICGSDKRGTIYGVYDLSEQIGVSPWHYWGDVPVPHREKLFVKAGRFVTGPPSVKYRGIFINDEAPALSGWIQEKFGRAPGWPKSANYGPGFYTNVFELMLRLRANYLWPAMWNNAFNEDDTNNPVLADEYGIVMGTSHQEPMLRAQKEWDRRFQKTLGSWNYAKYPEVLENFWREGVRRNRPYESIITLGLRGADDTEMAPGGPEANRALLEKIVGIQRQLIAEEVNPDLTRVPQMWCLYKEVMDYYDAGMRVPDDVTLLWAEDNWGNVRRLPTAAERPRSGGAGVYYHFDYHGAPRSYQWINTSPIPKVWDQMSLAKQYGADRVWIVNVGHFNKGSELPLEFFMSLAWDTSRWTNENLDDFTRLWAAREFGAEHAGEIAQLIRAYTQFNGRRKPELLDAATYSLVNYREFETVAADYAALAVRAQKVSDQLAPGQRDAFYGFVLYPIKACAQLNAMYLAAAKNAFYARQGRASANDFAIETRALFTSQTNLANHYNSVYAGGKWNHMMDQPYIGYISWNDPKQNNLNAVKLVEIPLPEAAAMGVAVEGSADTAGGTLAFDKFGQASRYADVFNAGKMAFEFSTTVSEPWIVLNESHGKVEKERRIEISIDWRKAPPGKSTGKVEFSGAGTNFTVNINLFNPSEPAREALQGFVEADGFVSIEAEHYTKKTDAGASRWIKIPDYGHTLSGMRADAPAEALATPGKDSPCLEYKMYLFNHGKVEVESIVGPTLSFMPGRPVRYAVSFDDEPPQEVTIVPEVFEGYYTNPVWSESVKNNYHKAISTHTIQEPGWHTLKIWMVDPAVVLQKTIVNTGGVKPSYLGPPESFRR
jgi:hypothetical protein